MKNTRCCPEENYYINYFVVHNLDLSVEVLITCYNTIKHEEVT